MSTRDKFLKIALPLLIIVAAIAIFAALMLFKKQPPKHPAIAKGALVEVLPVTRKDVAISILASGTVEAHREISLDPQVSGKVVKLGKGFASGAFFAKGDLLLQIEPTDYRLAVDQAEAALARAEVELATTEGQAAIAREEWQRLDLQGDAKPSPLVLYEPQLKNARANVASARASFDMAQLNLQRTTLLAPYDLRIRNEQVDLGQFVRSGNKIATLTSSNKAEVIVSLPHDDLKWVTIPGPGVRDAGSEGQITLRQGETDRVWQGRIDRALGEVDPRGRMVQVAVTVNDPYRLKQTASQPPYLEVGMFVNVALEGPLLEQVVVLPRRALRDNRSVWLATENNLLEIRPVEILRLEKERAIISGGLEHDDRVILTTLTGVADGMQLRIADKEQ